jgi:glycine amidinotransferase
MERLTNSVSTSSAPVNSYNEWDPLEEAIVGSVDGAAIPPWHVALKGAVPIAFWRAIQQYGGMRYPPQEIEPAKANLDEFIGLLQAEGVTVRRPDIIDSNQKYSTPDWRSSGFCTASPRDILLVIGNEIIEANMTWRSRYFEIYAYRTLLKEYFEKGAKWTAAPKARLKDELYDNTYEVPEKGKDNRYVINESEPTFDAADFVRCGRDIFVQRSNTTNYLGIEWLRRNLGAEYSIHEIISQCPQPMHIDTTFVPLAPGKVLVSPEFLNKEELPDIVKRWDILEAPQPVPSLGMAAQLSSTWLSMNVLMLDEERVIVETRQEPLIKALKDWGFKPIPCNFESYYGFGGSFHCATVDIRRRGTLQSYF